MKKVTFTLFFLLLFIGVNTYASDVVTKRYVATMKMERDRAVVRIVKLWFRKAPEKALAKEILVLVSKETYLASTAPVADVNDLYFSRPEGFIKENFPFSIFLTFLNREGINLEPISFFEGRRFQLKKKKGGNL